MSATIRGLLLGQLAMVIFACGSDVEPTPADESDITPVDTGGELGPDADVPVDGSADTATDAGASDGSSTADTVFPELPSQEGCGDGEIGGTEECDDGDLNSDTDVDACRADCREARCGDGVVDTAEACDDGNPLSGDGCSRLCVVETTLTDVEPNSSFALAQTVVSGQVLVGTLSEGDVDCFRVAVTGEGWIRASTAAEDGTCVTDTTLVLYGPAGTVLTTAQDDFAGVCSVLNPDTNEQARYLTPGNHVVCVEGLLRTSVDEYRLVIDTGTDSCDRFAPSAEDDRDSDGLADPCDDDDDGDGTPDTTDNCPSLRNDETELDFATDESGFIRHWLLAGDYPQSGGPECLPTTDMEPGAVAELSPEIGTMAATVQWHVASTTSDRIDLGTRLGIRNGQAAWAFVYVRSATERAAQLRIGSDDGVRVWFNGTEVLSVQTCRGVNRDQNTAAVRLRAGVNRLVMKVRNNSGAWGYLARFTTPEGVAITDLGIELSGSGRVVANQADADRDGRGDLCDTTPYPVMIP